MGTWRDVDFQHQFRLNSFVQLIEGMTRTFLPDSIDTGDVPRCCGRLPEVCSDYYSTLNIPPQCSEVWLVEAHPDEVLQRSFNRWRRSSARDFDATPSLMSSPSCRGEEFLSSIPRQFSIHPQNGIFSHEINSGAATVIILKFAFPLSASCVDSKSFLSKYFYEL